jgi:hypothetical protein
MRRAAFGYLLAMLCIYLVAAVAAGFFVIRKARSFTPPIASPRITKRQFSLKSLLIGSAMLALFLAVLRSLIRLADGHEEILMMGVYMLVNTMICGIVIGRFYVDRRRR